MTLLSKGIELNLGLEQDAWPRVGNEVELILRKREKRTGRHQGVAVLALFLVSAGCGRRTIPPPEAAVRAYVLAVDNRDVEGLYQLMSDGARQAVSKDDLALLMEENQRELTELAAALEGGTFPPRNWCSVRSRTW